MRQQMNERKKELRSILTQLLLGLGMKQPRIMLTMAIISAYQVEEEMKSWVATFYGKEDTMTAKAFISKLNSLIDTEAV